jgi:hypothetical protein
VIGKESATIFLPIFETPNCRGAELTGADFPKG